MAPPPATDVRRRSSTSWRLELRDALDGMDSEAAHRSLDRVLATLSVHAALRDVVLPYLRELGDRWEAGEVTVAQEHFASESIPGATRWGSREIGIS